MNIKEAMFLAVCLICMLILKPEVGIHKVQNCEIAQGPVIAVNESLSRKVSIDLANDGNHYVINSELLNKLNSGDEGIKNKLLNKKIEVYYVSYWSPIDPFNTQKTVAAVKSGDHFISDFQ